MHLLTHCTQRVAGQRHSMLPAYQTAHPTDVGVVNGVGAAVSFAPYELFRSGRLQLPVLTHEMTFSVKEEKGVVEALVLSFIDADDNIGSIFLCHLPDLCC